ncbi:MAG: iron-siderophore ABC transporter substrate-binding protein [Pseudomonadota bacterium]
MSAWVALWLLMPTQSLSLSSDCAGRTLSGEALLAGDVCVPYAPKRIVTLDPFYTLLMSLDLGASVVASTQSGRDLPQQVPENLVTVGQATAPNLEAILAQDPDLILGAAYGQEKLLSSLSEIAPTVLIDTSDWRLYYQTIARAVGQPEKAEHALDAFQARLDATAALLPDHTTVSFLRIVPGGFQVYVDGPEAYAPISLLTELGLARPPFETATDDTVLRRPTLEGLLELQGDILIYTIGGAHHEGNAEELEKEVTSTAIWQALPAVREGRAFRVEPKHWMGFGGLPSAHAVLADIRRIFGLPPE